MPKVRKGKDDARDIFWHDVRELGFSGGVHEQDLVDLTC